jgi:hypothetical protein
MPTISEEARKTRIEAALKALLRDSERIPVPWQDTIKTFPVIKISLDSVLLNPRSHRIRAQLESHPQRQLVLESPFCEESQEIITTVLHGTEGYERLKTNLAEEDQREAGVVTRAGLLVNGNTRAAALRDIEKKYIRVAVLPEDATQEEIDELELRLQMKQDLKQDYTFTNELLFVDELITRYSRTHEQIALDLRWAASRSPKELKKGKEHVCQWVRMLSLIRQIQELSGQKLRLTEFDEKKQVLIEIDDEYQQAREVDPEKAAKVRDTRMIGLLVGLGYRELRQIDERFLENYLIPSLAEDKMLGKYVDTLTMDQTTDDNLPGLEVLPPQLEDSVRGPAPLLRLVAASANDEQVELPTGDTERVVLPRDDVVEAIRRAMDEAADTARLDRRAGNQLRAPVSRLESAERELRVGLEAYRAVKVDSSLDKKKLTRLLGKIRRTVEAFTDELSSLT